jgi:hypothetical protein
MAKVVRSPVLVLGIAAAVAVVLAISSVALTRQAGRGAFVPEPYFQGLADKLQTAARIHIQSKDQSTDLAYAPETGWVVAAKDGYRARYEEVQRLLLALADLQRVERKTKEAKWHKRLLLTDPREKGEGTLLHVLDNKGKPLAELIVGLNADVDNVGEKAEPYVRAPGDNQVWLARGEAISTLSANGDDWLDKLVIDLPKSAVVRVDIKPEAGTPFAIARAKPEDKTFTLEGAPGAKTRATSLDNLAEALADLRLRDVARQDRVTFTEASPSAAFRTSEGLIIRADIAKLGEDHWIRLSASASPDASAKGKGQAESLKRLLSPWVYEIERWKGEQLMAAQSSLLETPPEQPAPKASDANVRGAAPANPPPTNKAAPVHEPAKKPAPPANRPKGKSPN